MSVIDGLPFPQDKAKYIVDALDPVMEEMIAELLTEGPESPTDFMIDWLRRRSGGDISKAKLSIKTKNANLKNEVQNAKAALEEMGGAIRAAPGEDEAQEEEEDDDMEELEEPPEPAPAPAPGKKKARGAVSAEAVSGNKADFKPPVHAKTDEQKNRLKATLSKSFMFQAVEGKDLEAIVMAMKEVKLKAGEKVISEGDNGDFMFIIEEGTLECIKKIDGKDKVVKTVNTGDVFGELAIMYNQKRAASVVSKNKCVCWQLDRDCFNFIVKDAAANRRTKYDNFLKNVKLIESLDAAARSQMVDALASETFKKGQTIITEGEPGDKFYILEEGALYATKEKKRVKEYKAGDYFGELALLKNQPRAASVIVDSKEAKLLWMSRQAFSKLLGPLGDILAKQTSAYK